MNREPENFSRKLALLSLVVAAGCCSCSAVTRQVARDATPAAIDSGVPAALSEKNQKALAEGIEPERVEQATEKVTAAATDGWVNAMSEDERQARVVAAVAPVVASLVDASMESALRDEHLDRIRELAKQATLGFQEAIDEVAEKRDQGAIPADKGNVLEAADRLAEGGGMTLYLVAALAGLFAALLLAGAFWAVSRKRRYEREAARREQALEAAARVLSREGMPLAESSSRPESPAGAGALADPDAELLRNTVRRLRSARSEAEPTKKESTA